MDTFDPLLYVKVLMSTAFLWNAGETAYLEETETNLRDCLNAQIIAEAWTEEHQPLNLFNWSDEQLDQTKPIVHVVCKLSEHHFTGEPYREGIHINGSR